MKNSLLESSSALLETNNYCDGAQREEAITDLASGSGAILPTEESLAMLLGVADGRALTEILNDALFGPITALTQGKRIRAQLVGLCHRLLDTSQLSTLRKAKQGKLAAEIVELIHLGSLVVDDIEDGSRVRRGRPALHVQYGTPVALNAGNWLYFWPAELLRRMELPEEKLAGVYERYQRTLLRAHFGQAADLGCRVERLAQSQVAPACLSTMELKTGALMGFSAALGAVVAGAPERAIAVLDAFGKQLGVALQMFDDLGNVIGRCEPAKRFEDLLMKRLSWVWACAAKNSSSEDYRGFVAAVDRLPDERLLSNWMAQAELIATVRQSARSHLEIAFRQLANGLDEAGAESSKVAFNELCALGAEIAVAYE